MQCRYAWASDGRVAFAQKLLRVACGFGGARVPRCLHRTIEFHTQCKSVHTVSSYKPYYYKRKGPPENELWDQFFARPTEWWDHRTCKLSPQSPDFKHRKNYWGLWSLNKGGTRKTDIPNLYERLAEIDAGPEGNKPLKPLSVDAAWKDLFDRPWYYKDVRRAKVSSRSPDFKHKETNLGLWLHTAPDWVKRDAAQLDAAFFKEKPKIQMSEEMGKALVEAEGSDEDEENWASGAESDGLEWSEEQKQQGVDILLSALEHDLSEEAEPPEEVMKGGLMQHQKQGLAWMLKREREVPAGGMLCDEQGLGKTMQALGLIASNPRPEPPVAAEGGEDGWELQERVSGAEASTSGLDEYDSDEYDDIDLPIKATLVIVPKSLMGQWKTAIQAWTNLKVLWYADTDRKKHQEPESLAPYDIVLATPTVVRFDSPDHLRRSIFRVEWWRIIIDEAQSIKQHTTALAAAVSRLQVQRGGARWLMTGTPVQNSPKELFSYLHFLQYKPFCSMPAFAALFAGNDMSVVVPRLREIVRPIMLRRTKASTVDGRPIMPLPERRVALQPVEFTEEEREQYDSICSDFAQLLLEAEGDLRREAFLMQLNQLRQACDHPWLAKGFIHLKESVKLMPQLEELDEGDQRLSQVQDAASRYEESAKVRAVCEILAKYSGEEKILVFSQWTSMLDFVQYSVHQMGINYRRLDGSMNTKQREAAVSDFTTDPEVRVFLISLLAGKEGLNLACASRVVLLEPHFNPMHEEQAIDRTHRYGQARNVFAHKLYIPGTVEERLLELQEYKRQVCEAIIQETEGPSTGSSRITGGLSMEDLRFLLSGERRKAFRHAVEV